MALIGNGKNHKTVKTSKYPKTFQFFCTISGIFRKINILDSDKSGTIIETISVLQLQKCTQSFIKYLYGKCLLQKALS